MSKLERVKVLDIMHVAGFTEYSSDLVLKKCVGDVLYFLNVTGSVISTHLSDRIVLGLSKESGFKSHISIYHKGFDLLSRERVEESKIVVLGTVVENDTATLGAECTSPFSFLNQNFHLYQSGKPLSLACVHKQFKRFEEEKIEIDNGLYLFEKNIVLGQWCLWDTQPECVHKKVRDHAYKLDKSFTLISKEFNISRECFNRLVNAYVGNYSICREMYTKMGISRQDSIRIYKELINKDKIPKSSFWDNYVDHRCKRYQARLDLPDNLDVDTISENCTIEELVIAYQNKSFLKKKNFIEKCKTSVRTCWKTKKINTIEFESIVVAPSRIPYIVPMYLPEYLEMTKLKKKLNEDLNFKTRLGKCVEKRAAAIRKEEFLKYMRESLERNRIEDEKFRRHFDSQKAAKAAKKEKRLQRRKQMEIEKEIREAKESEERLKKKRILENFRMHQIIVYRLMRMYASDNSNIDFNSASEKLSKFLGNKNRETYWKRIMSKSLYEIKREREEKKKRRQEYKDAARKGRNRWMAMNGYAEYLAIGKRKHADDKDRRVKPKVEGSFTGEITETNRAKRFIKLKNIDDDPEAKVALKEIVNSEDFHVVLTDINDKKSVRRIASKLIPFMLKVSEVGKYFYDCSEDAETEELKGLISDAPEWKKKENSEFVMRFYRPALRTLLQKNHKEFTSTEIKGLLET